MNNTPGSCGPAKMDDLCRCCKRPTTNTKKLTYLYDGAVSSGAPITGCRHVEEIKTEGSLDYICVDFDIPWSHHAKRRV